MIAMRKLRNFGYKKTVLLLIIAFACCMNSCQKKTNAPPQKPVVNVTVAKVEQKDVRLFAEYTGYTKACETVTIHARVKGYLEQMLFTEGQIVKKGIDKLYVIEQREYQADLEIAEAKMQRTQAAMELQNLNFQRAEKLVKDGTISEEEYDTKRNAYEGSITEFNQARAEYDNAKRNFEYTEITAPITGKISRTLVDAGNLVGGLLDTELATIMNLNPIHVYFQISDVDFNRFNQKAINELKEQEKLDGTYQLHANIRMGFLNKDSSGTENGEEQYPYEGDVNYTDNTIDQNTGMITLRAVVPNPEYVIFPGQICRVMSAVDEVKDALLVHEKAVGIDLGSHYLMVVGKDNKVERRNIELGELVEENMYIVTRGIEAGETYIIDGLLQVHAGSEVNVIP